MKNIINAIFILCLAVATSSCTESDKSKVIGVWKLKTRTTDIPFDVNNDGSFSTNLVDEIDCNEIETLTFEENGTVFSGNEASVILKYFKTADSNTYGLNVECNKDGVISFASSYNEIDENTIQVSGRDYVISNNEMTVVFEGAVKIYNEDFSEIIETRDLTLVYTK